MKKKNENKIILKQWVQVFIIIFVILLMAFSLWAIAKSVKPNAAQSKELYSYNYTNDLNYKVYIKQNKFYTQPYMEMNKQYIASLIDHIDVTTKYHFQSTEDLQYTYNYEIVATVKGIFADSEEKASEVWSKAYPIAPMQTQTGTGKTIDIDKTVSIDYNQYNAIMTDFRNSFGLSVDAVVDVAFKVTITGGLPGQEQTLKETNNVLLQIPLLKTTIQMKPTFENNGRNVINAKPVVNNEKNIPLLIFGVALLIFSIYMFIIFSKKLLKATKKSEYVLQLNKILKEYGDIIAESDNLPDLSQYDIVSIKHFQDIVDIEEELHSPIICNEVREDLETWFIIIYDKTAYRYVLKYENFGKIINRKY